MTAIIIIDIETRDTVGILLVNGTHVLLDEPFVIPRYVGRNDKGEDEYEDVEYAQLIQVYYSFANQEGYNKTVSSAHFAVTDSGSNESIINPDIAYTAYPLDGIFKKYMPVFTECGATKIFAGFIFLIWKSRIGI